jgi:hypothetical protein
LITGYRAAIRRLQRILDKDFASRWRRLRRPGPRPASISFGIIGKTSTQWPWHVADKIGLYKKRGLTVSLVTLGSAASTAQQLAAGSLNVSEQRVDARRPDHDAVALAEVERDDRERRRRRVSGVTTTIVPSASAPSARIGRLRASAAAAPIAATS